MWEEEKLGPRGENGAPVGLAALHSYLDDCAHFHLRHEPPLTFSPPQFALQRVVEQRDFWIWTTTDGEGELWFVVASDGAGHPARWAYAVTACGRDASEFPDDVLAEYKGA